MNILKNNFLLISILILAAFLRFYRLDELMHLIADQGWFYVQARDMILTGNIPLVGITTSHIWLHQGAYWTYILGVLFKLFNFNPLIPGYFASALGILAVILVYFVSKEMFSKPIATISALIYATSPLIVFDARFPYHTSPIPFLATLFILSVYRWTYKEKIIYFPISIFLLSVLYNFEIATFSLAIFLFFCTILRISKKKKMGCRN